MTPLDAVFMGLIGGSVCFGKSLLLDKLRIDDVVGAFPVHACAGIWGTLAVAVLGNPESWGTGLSRWEQFAVQAKGVGMCFAWAFGMGIMLIWLLNRWFPIRVKLYR